MHYTTEDGREINVGIMHKPIIIPRYPDKPCRRTTIWLHVKPNDKWPAIDIEEYATCNPNDQFCKKLGRSLAMDKFMSNFEVCETMLTKKDRTVIFVTLLPDLKRKAKKDRKLEHRQRKLANNNGLCSIATCKQ